MTGLGTRGGNVSEVCLEWVELAACSRVSLGSVRRILNVERNGEKKSTRGRKVGMWTHHHPLGDENSRWMNVYAPIRHSPRRAFFSLGSASMIEDREIEGVENAFLTSKERRKT